MSFIIIFQTLATWAVSQLMSLAQLYKFGLSRTTNTSLLFAMSYKLDTLSFNDIFFLSLLLSFSLFNYSSTLFFFFDISNMY